MQDRFKYRVFIKNWKNGKSLMCNVHSLHIGTNKVIVSGNCGNVSVQLNKDNILMQCTGLKDKNGKLIYEGDIVRYTEIELDEDTKWEIAEVVWGGNYDYPAFDLKNKDFDGINAFSYLFGDGWTIEIIGNIYENPDMIEEK